MAPLIRWLAEQKRFDGDPLGPEIRASFLRAGKSKRARSPHQERDDQDRPHQERDDQRPDRLTKNARTRIDLSKKDQAASPTTPQSRDQETTTASTSMKEPKGEWLSKLRVKENDRHLRKKRGGSA